MPDSTGQQLNGGPRSLLVNAGTTGAVIDNALGQANIPAGMPLHFWSSDECIVTTVDTATGAIDLTIDKDQLPAPASAITSLTGVFDDAANTLSIAIGYLNDNGVASTTTVATAIDLSDLQGPWDRQSDGSAAVQGDADIAYDDGKVRMGKYGQGTYDDPTPTRLAAFDANGNLVEFKDFCVEWTGTRAQLLALRNASNLIPGCVYTITDFSRGTLNNSVLIHTHAAAKNKLFKDVAVETGWDVAPWFGTYDIDTARVIELHDNLQNIIKSDNGDEIETFPWGNTRVTGNQFSDFDFNYNDSGARVDNNVGMPTGRLDITGATTYVANNEFQSQTDVDALDGAQVFRTTVQSNGRLLATGITVERCTIGNYAYFRSDGIDIRSSVLEAGALVYGTGGVGRIDQYRFGRSYNDFRNCALVDLDDGSVDDYSKTYANGAKRIKLNGCNAQSNGYFQAYPGKELEATYCSVADGGYIRARDGVLTITNSHMNSAGRVDHFSSGANRVTHSHCKTSGYIYFGETVTGTLVDYCSAAESGYIAMRDASGAGTRAHRCRVSAGYILVSDSTAALVYYSSVESVNSYIRIDDSPAFSVFNVCAQSYGRMNVLAGRAGGVNGIELNSTGYLRLSGGAGNINHSAFVAYFYLYVTNQTGGSKQGLYGRGRQTLTVGGAAQTGVAETNVI